MNERYDVIVVGGGIMGTAAARHLALQRRTTLLLERFSIGHANASSGGPTRIFRFAYEDPDYVRLAIRARPAWDELQDAAGEPLLAVTGNLDVGPTALRRADRLEAAGLAAHRMTAQEARERWPDLHLAPTSDIVFQPDGGVLRAAPAVRAQARLAIEAGADVREMTPVASMNPFEGGVRVLTDRGEEFEAPVAIVSVGAWAGPMLEAVGIDLPLRPTLEQASYFRIAASPGADDAPGDSSSRLPTLMDWATHVDRPPYLVPDPFEQEPGHFKAGLHHTGPVVDAAKRTFDVDPVRLEALRRWVHEHVPGSREPDRTDTCLYTVTPDQDFVLDRVGPLVIASPCSGHGFKFAPLFGGVLADLAMGRRPAIPLDRFSLSRPALRSPVWRRATG
jgi:sarcosine oxidase